MGSNESATFPRALALVSAVSCRASSGLDISEPVYDSRTHSVVVIPSGAHLVGVFDSGTATVAGEARLFVVRQRILFPDGRKVAMSAEPGAGGMGEAGLGGLVDTDAGHAYAEPVTTGLRVK